MSNSPKAKSRRTQDLLAKEQQTQAEEPRSINQIERTPLPAIYANNISLSVTQWDFRFVYGRIVHSDDKNVDIENEIMVYMSPQHAKAMSNILVENLKKYEETFGTINLVRRDDRTD